MIPDLAIGGLLQEPICESAIEYHTSKMSGILLRLQLVDVLWYQYHINGLVQERHNSTANALELRLSCTKPLTFFVYFLTKFQVERDAKIGKLSADTAMQQKVEILAALKKLGESLAPEEEAYLQANGSSSLKQFEEVSGDIGKLRPRQNGRHFADDTFNWNENVQYEFR